MRRENDYITFDRKSFLHEVVLNCPNNFVLEIDGNLPKNIFEDYRLNQDNRLRITLGNRKIISEFLRSEDEEISKNSVGAILKNKDSIWFESYHLYNYGTPSKSKHTVYIHDAFPNELLDRLLKTKILTEA